jgi:hypothetical protein
MTLEEINAHFGTEFRLGSEVLVNRDPKSPHVGTVVGTEHCFLKLVLNGDNQEYPACYDPEVCQIIQA